MYSSLQLSIKYLRYWLTASNGKGHGVHSPFVFQFITEVLNDNRQYYCYGTIERLRSQLKNDKTEFTLEDLGAGSRIHATYKRRVSDIAKTSLKSKKFSQLFFRIINFYFSGSLKKDATILEL